MRKRLTIPIRDDNPICNAGLTLAALIAERFEPSDLLFIAILRAGIPVVDWLTRLLPGSTGVATSLFVGHGIDLVSFGSIRAAYPKSQIVFVDGWTGKGGVARELLRLGVGPLAVLSDPWMQATFRGTQEDILSPSACFTGPTTLGFSRTFTRCPGQSFGTFQFPRTYLEPDITRAWIESCPTRAGSQGRLTISDLGCNYRPHHNSSKLIRLHSNEVCRALINSNPDEVLFACSRKVARSRYDLLLELADSQNIPQRFNVSGLLDLGAIVACTLNLQAIA